MRKVFLQILPLLTCALLLASLTGPTAFAAGRSSAPQTTQAPVVLVSSRILVPTFSAAAKHGGPYLRFDPCVKAISSIYPDSPEQPTSFDTTFYIYNGCGLFLSNISVAIQLQASCGPSGLVPWYQNTFSVYGLQNGVGSVLWRARFLLTCIIDGSPAPASLQLAGRAGAECYNAYTLCQGSSTTGYFFPL